MKKNVLKTKIFWIIVALIFYLNNEEDNNMVTGRVVEIETAGDGAMIVKLRKLFSRRLFFEVEITESSEFSPAELSIHYGQILSLPCDEI